MHDGPNEPAFGEASDPYSHRNEDAGQLERPVAGDAAGHAGDQRLFHDVCRQRVHLDAVGSKRRRSADVGDDGAREGDAGVEDEADVVHVGSGDGQPLRTRDCGRTTGRRGGPGVEHVVAWREALEGEAAVSISRGAVGVLGSPVVGLRAWYGQDFGQINQLLADPKADLTQRAKAFKQALSLFVAQRRPSGPAEHDTIEVEGTAPGYTDVRVADLLGGAELDGRGRREARDVGIERPDVRFASGTGRVAGRARARLHEHVVAARRQPPRAIPPIVVAQTQRRGEGRSRQQAGERAGQHADRHACERAAVRVHHLATDGAGARQGEVDVGEDPAVLQVEHRRRTRDLPLGLQVHGPVARRVRQEDIATGCETRDLVPATVVGSLGSGEPGACGLLRRHANRRPVDGLAGVGGNDAATDDCSAAGGLLGRHGGTEQEGGEENGHRMAYGMVYGMVYGMDGWNDLGAA